MCFTERWRFDGWQTIPGLMQIELIPVSFVIPTRNRAGVLRRTLESLAQQSTQPAEVILVDASDDEATQSMCADGRIPGLASAIAWHAAEVARAASQRNQGVRTCSQSAVGFMDDDILLDPMCIGRLWDALQADPALGGVNAMITNCRYEKPGNISRVVFQLMAGRAVSPRGRAKALLRILSWSADSVALDRARS